MSASQKTVRKQKQKQFAAQIIAYTLRNLQVKQAFVTENEKREREEKIEIEIGKLLEIYR